MKLGYIVLILSLNASLSANPQHYTIDGMVGAQPAKVCWLIKRMNSPEGFGGLNVKNRLILHGPPGNGKTTLAHKIAERTGSQLISLDGPSVVGSYVGSGAKNIRQLFQKAQELSAEGRVIVFVDEVDAIANNNKTEFRLEHEAALQQLWLELDRYKDDNHIFVVFATNHMEKLSKIFLDRFGGNAIEIPNPGPKQRQQILEHYFTKAHIPLEQEVLEALIKKTEGLSIRSIKDLATEVRMTAEIESSGVMAEPMLWSSLDAIKNKFHDHTSQEEQDRYVQRIATYVGIASSSLSTVISLSQITGFAGFLLYLVLAQQSGNTA